MYSTSYIALLSPRFPHTPHSPPMAPTPSHCDTCDSSFASKGALKRHRSTAEHMERDPATSPSGISAIKPAKSIRCHLCNLNFPSKSQRKKHKYTPQHRSLEVRERAVHSGIPTFNCFLCDFTFEKRKKLQRHFYAPVHQRAETERLASRTGIPAANWVSGVPLSSLPARFESKAERTCHSCQLTFANIIFYRKHAKSGCRTPHATFSPNPTFAGRPYGETLRASVASPTRGLLQTHPYSDMHR